MAFDLDFRSLEDHDSSALSHSKEVVQGTFRFRISGDARSTQGDLRFFYGRCGGGRGARWCNCTPGNYKIITKIKSIIIRLLFNLVDYMIPSLKI